MQDRPNIDATVAEAQQALGASILTELELGLTFLDVAETTTDRKHARRSLDNAITALRTADRMLSTVQADTVDLDAVAQHRAELARRLRITKLLALDGAGPLPALGSRER
jgi:hypothetical protein